MNEMKKSRQDRLHTYFYLSDYNYNNYETLKREAWNSAHLSVGFSFPSLLQGYRRFLDSP